MVKHIQRGTLFLVLFIFCAGSSVFAYTDCYRSCMDASDCLNPSAGSTSSYCSGTQVRCSSECRGSGKSYGAIAYSKKTGAYGYSQGWTNQKKAEAVALKNCKDNGKGCKKEVWFYNSCGSVASDGKSVTWGQADTSGKAAQSALDKCNQRFFKGKCETKVTQCSGT